MANRTGPSSGIANWTHFADGNWTRFADAIKEKTNQTEAGGSRWEGRKLMMA